MIKKILKNNIFVAVICCLLCFAVGAKAADSYYNAANFLYTSPDSTWNVSNLTDALNSLYTTKSNLTSLKQIGTASAGNILTGYSGVVKGSTVNGSMSNYFGTTKSASTITESGSNALISIPSNGFYSTTSKLSVPVETIKQYITSLQSGVYYLGTGNRFDVSGVCNTYGINCSSLTANNFVVGISTVPNSSSSGNRQGDDSNVFVNLYGCTVSKNYDGSSILTVAGNTVKATGGTQGGYDLLPPEIYDYYDSYEDFYKEWGWLENYDYQVPGELYEDAKSGYSMSRTATSTATLFAYLVVGDIK